MHAAVSGDRWGCAPRKATTALAVFRVLVGLLFVYVGVLVAVLATIFALLIYADLGLDETAVGWAQ